MKNWMWAVLLAAALAAGGREGLPRGKEMEELALVTALALDGGKELTVTAVTGVRAGQEEEPEVLTGTGTTLAAACRDMAQEQASRPYLGQVGKLLLGENVDLDGALDFVARQGELRLDTLLYIVRGNAGMLLAQSAPQAARETPGTDRRGRTVGEILSRRAEGELSLVPALAPGEDGTLAPASWAVLGPNGVEGYLEEDAALGAELLLGSGKGTVAVLPSGTVELTSARLTGWGGTLTCALSGRTVQGQASGEELAAWGTEKVEAALAPGWDGWSLRRRLSLWPAREETSGPFTVRVTGKVAEGRGG